MSKIKCYSVRLAELKSISEKSYKAKAYDGSEGDFRINSDLKVFFGKVHIGHIVVVINDHPEGDDELSCFLPGFVGFQHYPVSDAGIACQTIYDKFYNRK